MANEYIVNSDLENTIRRFKEVKKHLEENPSEPDDEFKKLYADLAASFYELSENLIWTFGFKLIDRDDAIQEGVLICLQKIDQFNPDLGTAFTYYTTCVYNRYCQLYRTSKTQLEIKRRYHAHLINKNDNMVMDASTSNSVRGKFHKKKVKII